MVVVCFVSVFVMPITVLLCACVRACVRACVCACMLVWCSPAVRMVSLWFLLVYLDSEGHWAS